MRLLRTDYKADGIFGKLLDDDGDQLAVTLEHSYDCKPLVPAGTYTCVRYASPHFGYDVFMLQDVPGHTAIELHRANWQKDLHGCIGLGRDVTESPEGTMITNSAATFYDFMEHMEGVDTFQLTIEDGIGT